MKISNRNIKLSVILILSCGLYLFAEESNVQENENDDISLSQLYQEIQSNLPEKIDDEVFKKGYDLINGIDCIFGDLACLVQAEAIELKDKDAKSDLLQAIIDTRKVLNTIKMDFNNNPTRTQFHNILTMLNAIIKHLEEALKGGFTSFAAFDPEIYKTRSQSTDDEFYDDELLNETYEKTNEYFKSVQKRSEKAGLTIINIAYRNSIDKIVQLFAKYKLHWKGLTAGLGIAGLTYAWYLFNECTDGTDPEKRPRRSYSIDAEGNPIYHEIKSSIFKKACQAILGNQWGEKVHTRLNRFIHDDLNLGWPEKLTRHTNLGEIAEGRGNLNNTENFFVNYNTGHLPAAAAMWYLADRFGLKDYVERKVSKLQKNILKLHYFLKGGAYYQRYRFKKDKFRIEPRYLFEDIIGLDHAKQVLGEIIKYIEDPETYDRQGITPKIGYLLFGPSRTGKSMIAEALAGELQKLKGSSDDFPFFAIEARHISSEGSFNMIMSLVKHYAPCIIFIDEIDMLNLHRKFKNKNVLLSEFLSTISGCLNPDPDKQVIIIGATNEPHNLDPSLRSRLPVHIPFDYPSFIHRAECLVRELEGKGLPIEGNFDIKSLAEQTEGCSFEQLHDIVNHAQFITRETGKPITHDDIEKSLNTEIRNIIYHDYKHLSDEEQNILAVHMAGHALAYNLIESDAEKLAQVTIRPVKTKIEDENQWSYYFKDKRRPIIQYGHIFTNYTGDSLKFTSKVELKRKCMIELAGSVAEEIVFDTSHITKDTCSADDKTKAFHWAKMYCLDGLDEKQIEHSKALQNKVTQEACQMVDACKKEVAELFKDKKDLIILTAMGLRQFDILSCKAIEDYISLHKMLDGKSLEEFVKELEEQAEAELEEQQTSSPQGQQEQPEMSEQEITKAISDELGIKES